MIEYHGSQCKVVSREIFRIGWETKMIKISQIVVAFG